MNIDGRLHEFRHDRTNICRLRLGVKAIKDSGQLVSLLLRSLGHGQPGRKCHEGAKDLNEFDNELGTNFFPHIEQGSQNGERGLFHGYDSGASRLDRHQSQLT